MHEQVTRASDVLEALNVSAATLQLIQTQLQLFRFVILTSLRTALPSVVSVKLRRNQLFLVSGRSLDLALKHGNTEQYLRETLKDMVFDHDDKIISDLLDIDASVTSRLIKANKSNLLVTRHLGDLSSPFANATWTDALNTTALPAELPALTAESLVLVRNEALVNAALGVLANAEFKCARLYAVVLLLAQVIRYRYILGTSVVEGSASASRSYDCLYVTGSHFPTVFLPWSFNVLAKKDAAAKIQQMVEAMKQSFRAELGFNSTDVNQWSIEVVGESTKSYYNATAAVTPAIRAKQASYDEEHFLRNVVRACDESVGRDWEDGGDVERQLRLTAVFKTPLPSSKETLGHVITISAALLADPFFIGDPTLAELDYGTVGVRVMAQWLDSELRSNTPLRELIVNLSIRCPPGDGISPRPENSEAAALSDVGGPIRSFRIFHGVNKLDDSQVHYRRVPQQRRVNVCYNVQRFAYRPSSPRQGSRKRPKQP
ncbi:hypothetical protein MRX96_055416 [Rhipicephalus microplus]